MELALSQPPHHLCHRDLAASTPMLHTPLGTHTNKTCSPCRSGSHTSALSSPTLHSVWQHAPLIPGFAHSLVECKPCVPSGQEAGRVRSDGARVPATAPQRRPTCSARPQLPPYTDTAQANELWRLARTYTHTHTHTTAQHRTPSNTDTSITHCFGSPLPPPPSWRLEELLRRELSLLALTP